MVCSSLITEFKNRIGAALQRSIPSVVVLSLLGSSAIAQAEFLGLPIKSVTQVAIELFNSSPAGQPSIVTSLVTPVVGAWALQGKAYTSCQEVYNFQPNGKVIVTSASEVTTAEYAYSNNIRANQTLTQNASELNSTDTATTKEVELRLPVPVLAFIIKYDNNQPDCMGIQEDQTGDNQAYFAVIDKDRQTMQWCVDDKICPLTFKRLLP